MLNRPISAARRVWYDWYEPRQLARARVDKAQWGGGNVSVLIPTYNRADILMDRALPSVLSQSHKNLEIIVAAHGCTDDTVDRVLKIGDPRIVVVSVPRKRTYPPTPLNHWLAGPVAPLNATLAAATGDWLARIDDDDEWRWDHVESLLLHALAGNYEFVSSAYRVEKEDGWHTVGADRGIGGTQTWLWRSYLRFMRWNPDCWRKKWDRVNDTDLADRMRRAGVRIGYMDETTCSIRPRPGETKIGSQAYLTNPSVSDTYQFKRPGPPSYKGR